MPADQLSGLAPSHPIKPYGMPLINIQIMHDIYTCTYDILYYMKMSLMYMYVHVHVTPSLGSNGTINC